VKSNNQTAPYPQVLADLVQRVSYKANENWAVWLEDDLQRDKPGRHTGESRGLTLIIQRCGPDTYHPERVIVVNHYFAVPPATYDERSWTWWLFNTCFRNVEDHERMENFKVDGKVVFPPAHGPGNDPYMVLHYGDDIDRRTSFRGDVSDH
jgi:hypothetical protein